MGFDGSPKELSFKAAVNVWMDTLAKLIDCMAPYSPASLEEHRATTTSMLHGMKREQLQECPSSIRMERRFACTPNESWPTHGINIIVQLSRDGMI